MKNRPKPDFIDREIGRRLRLARITANIRQNRAAKLAGVTYQQIRNYEVGYNRVSAVIIARLAQLYQRPVGWFLEEVPFGDEPKADPAAGLVQRERIVTKVHDVLGDRPEQRGN
jgi:transcriptional regulator with XRE-family HTH domain